jgi:MFS family permease
MKRSSPGGNPYVLVIAASCILLITMGIRQSLGLFVLPIVGDTHLSLQSVSFALAVGQLMWGAAQPVMGALAHRYGSRIVMVIGTFIMAAGVALTPWAKSETSLVLTLGVLMAVGAAAGSFSILVGVASQGLPSHKHSTATGVINAGGSLGQMVFAPLAQFFVAGPGWNIGMVTMGASALLTLPLIGLLRGAKQPAALDAGQPRASAPLADVGLREQLRISLRNPSYILLHLGFFTCGFHIAFLVTHWPGDLKLCGLDGRVAANSLALVGLFNVAGSLSAGWLGQRYRMKNLLALLYASRALIVVCYLLMPKTAFNVYLVAGALGFTWLATVPPTAGIVGKLFGTRYIATLFGLTLFSHQIGAFLGAWLGGVAFEQRGSYDWIWYIDIALALAAALVNLPIREPMVVLQSATA